MEADPDPASNFSALFIVPGDDLDPDEVTSSLGLRPWNTWRKGDATHFNSGHQHTAPWGGWKYICDDQPFFHNLDELVQWWCDHLSAVCPELPRFHRMDWSIILSVLDQSGDIVKLSRATMAKAALLPFDLEVTVSCD